MPLTTIDQAHICPVLVGRSTQFRIVQKLIEQVGGHTTRRPIILISGEAGIGKSRLMSEAKVQASEKGFTILNGRCFEPDRMAPYAPFIDLLQEYYASRSSQEIRHNLGSLASDLVRIFPALREHDPNIKPPAPTTTDEEKRRLLDSLTQFFTQFSQPILIAIEDLHWSDEASLEFLLHFSRQAESHPILLMVTYRSEEIETELSQFLTILSRERRDLVEIPLTHLSNAESDEMVRTILGSPRAILHYFTSYHAGHTTRYFKRDFITS